MIRTRMAPSPTGEYHIGNLRTMLYNYAWAKKHSGAFVVRVEDTDRTRLVPGALERMIEDIHAYGLNWDEGPGADGEYSPYIQSERLDIYTKHVEMLVDEGHAYYCFCTSERLKEMREQQEKSGGMPKYDRQCRGIDIRIAKQRVLDGESYVVRLKIPDAETISYSDIVLGDISFNTDDVDDQVLLKSDGFPTYHLAVVVDDHLMNISTILRGMEWVSSTPKHILLYRYFGWEMPETGHLPLLLDPNGGKMSKRFGATHIRAFLESGFLPEATLNFLALLGWTHPEGKDIFTLEEFIEKFDIQQLHKSNAVFDREKLLWFNGMYIRQLSVDELSERLRKYDDRLELIDRVYFHKIIPLIQDRMRTLAEFDALTKYFFTDPKVSLDEVVQKGKSSEETKEMLKNVLAVLENVEENNWNVENLESTLRNVEGSLADWSAKQLFMTLRVAVTGEVATPPLFDVLQVLGKGTVIRRLSLYG